MIHDEFMSHLKMLNVNVKGRAIEKAPWVTELEGKVIGLPVEQWSRAIAWMVPRQKGPSLPSVKDFLAAVDAIAEGKDRPPPPPREKTEAELMAEVLADAERMEPARARATLRLAEETGHKFLSPPVLEILKRRAAADGGSPA